MVGHYNNNPIPYNVEILTPVCTCTHLVYISRHLKYVLLLVTALS